MLEIDVALGYSAKFAMAKLRKLRAEKAKMLVDKIQNEAF